jgi:mono/diheme cytochrome c family protein
MKTKAIKIIGVATLLIGGLLFTSSTFENNNLKDWVAPKEADGLKNPYLGKQISIDKGKVIFKNLCAICHGDKGKGDGMAGASLNPRPTNLTNEKVQLQSDGALYWKITTGKAPMAAYKEKLDKDERWHVVNYIRTLKKTKKSKK